jgi:hypothetical protein
LFRLLLFLAFFAIGIDLLHSLRALRFFHGIIGLIENGGEMIVVSLILYTFFKGYVFEGQSKGSPLSSG